MSKVTVEATEGAVEVDIVLGSTLRKTVEVEAFDSADFVVDGGQTLTVRKASTSAPTAEVAEVPKGVGVSDIVEGGDEDCGDGSGRTVIEKTADDEADASRPVVSDNFEANALALGTDLFDTKG